MTSLTDFSPRNASCSSVGHQLDRDKEFHKARLSQFGKMAYILGIRSPLPRFNCNEIAPMSCGLAGAAIKNHWGPYG
jgi:hypothetical protein